ncbi:MAG: glycosyltransferase [Hyphomonadaceae bacterium]
MTRIVFHHSQCAAGPTGQALLALAGELARRGHDVRLIVDRPGGGLERAFNAMLPVAVLAPQGGAVAPSALAQAIAAVEPERFIAVGRDSILRAAPLKALRALKAPLIGWERELLSQQDGKGIKGRASRTLTRSLYPACDSVVFPSPGAAEDAKAALDGKAINAISIWDPFALPGAGGVTPAEPALAERLKTPRIIAIGPLTDASDYPTLLRAFQYFARAKGGSLLILGEGEKRNSLEALSASLGLGEGVVFESGIDNPAYLLGLSDLFVSTARTDVSGFGIVQALAAGVPVISTDCPSAPRDILADGLFGKLTPLGDSRALWRVMRDTLEAIDARALWNSKIEGAEIMPDRSAMRARAAEFAVERAVDKWSALLSLEPQEQPVTQEPSPPASEAEQSAAPQSV